MPRLAPYLQRRGGGLFFRISVPYELRPMIGVREFTRALPEPTCRAASPMALELAAVAKRLFEELRTMSNVGSTDQEKLRQVIDKAKDKLRISELQDTVRDMEFEHVTQLHRLKRQHDEALQVARLEAENALLKQALLRPAEAPLRAQDVQHVATPAPMLKDVVEAFLAQYELRGKEQMLKKHKPALNMFLQVVGNKPVNELRRADINEFFDLLICLPPRWNDQCRQLGVSIRELACMDHEKTIGPKTFQDGYIASLRPFLRASIRDYGDQGFPDTLTTEGIEYLGDQEEDVNKQRAFRVHELERLFRGAEMQRFAADPELHDFYWLPLLGLFTGARVNEICQLNPQVDISQDQETGVWFLWINAESEADVGVRKSVKTGDSRKVPLHRVLIELGFLRHVERLRKLGAKRLFLSWQPVRGRASGEAEKWFRQFLVDVGLRDDTPKAKLLGMHAFRHTLLTYGQLSKPSPLNLTRITGHAAAVEGFSNVANNYLDKSILNNLQELKDLLDKLDYGITFIKPAI